MSNWKECTIGNVCETQTGPFGSLLHNEDYVENGTPIVTVEHLGSKSFTTQNLPCVSDEDKKRLSKYTLKEGDTVFSRVGSVDRCSYVSASYSGWLFSGRCLRVRPKDNTELNSQFLYYHFSNTKIKTFIRNIAVGATMPSINTKLLNEVPISIPSLAEQQKIAAILSSLDEKIETNRKINARLEELAQALFKSWFIDFEPFGGKMPEDWKIVKMSEVIEDVAAGPFGSKLPKACFTSEGTPIIDGANLKERIVDETFSKFVSPSKSNELGRAVAHRNDFVVTISGTIGQIAYIYGTSKFSDYLVSQRQFRFSLKKDKVNKHYISLLFANNIGKQKILSFGNQVGVPALSQPLKNFKNVEIILPGMIIQNSFGEIIESIDSLICKNKQESARLTEMRDTLLPKLMSGELIPE